MLTPDTSVPFTQRPRNARSNPARTQRDSQQHPLHPARPRPRSLARSPDLPAARSLLAGRAGHLTPARGLPTAGAPLAPRLSYGRLQRKETLGLPSAPSLFFPIALLSSCLGRAGVGLRFSSSRPSSLAPGGAEFCSQRCGAFIFAS
jgi:hypothetical protein